MREKEKPKFEVFLSALSSQSSDHLLQFLQNRLLKVFLSFVFIHVFRCLLKVETAQNDLCKLFAHLKWKPGAASLLDLSSNLVGLDMLMVRLCKLDQRLYMLPAGNLEEHNSLSLYGASQRWERGVIGRSVYTCQ